MQERMRNYHSKPQENKLALVSRDGLSIASTYPQAFVRLLHLGSDLSCLDCDSCCEIELLLEWLAYWSRERLFDITRTIGSDSRIEEHCCYFSLEIISFIDYWGRFLMLAIALIFAVHLYCWVICLFCLSSCVQLDSLALCVYFVLFRLSLISRPRLFSNWSLSDSNGRWSSSWARRTCQLALGLRLIQRVGCWSQWSNKYKRNW